MKPVRTPEELGAALAAARERTGMTKAAVGEALGTTGQRIGDYERGTFAANGRTLMRHLELLGHQLAIVPLIETAPETAPASTLAAETPSAGVPGCTGGAEAAPGATIWRTRAINLQRELVETKGPCRIENGCVRHHLHKGPCAFEEAFCCNRGDHPGHIGDASDGEWNWTPTADGGWYSGPHGPDICPNVGCQHEGGTA